MNATTADVFLSYRRTDASAVRQIQAYLKEAGLATFLDRNQLPAGRPWRSALEQAITRLWLSRCISWRDPLHHRRTMPTR